MLQFLGALAGPLLGGLATKSAAKSNSASIAATNVMNQQINADNLAFARESRDIAQHDRLEDYWRWLEFAQNSTGWALRDMFDAADQSGIHRLAVLGGAQGSGYSGGTALPGAPGSIAMQPEGGTGFEGDAIGDAIAAMTNFARERAREDSDNKVKSAQADYFEAEAELARARSRTEIANARAATYGGRGPSDSSSRPAAPPEDLLKGIQMPDGSVRQVPVGPDTDEVVMGGTIYLYDKARDLFVPKEGAGDERLSRRPKRPTRVNIETPPSRGSRGRSQ